MVFGEGKDLES